MFMQKAESDLLLNSLHPTHHVLEWGSGASTLEIADKVNSIVSVEHSREWFNQLAKPPNLILILAEPNSDFVEGETDGTYSQFKTYIHAPLNYGPFDVILIDGRARVECAKICCKISKPETMIFIHDFDRKEYAPIMDFLTLVESIDHMGLFKL